MVARNPSKFRVGVRIPISSQREYPRYAVRPEILAWDEKSAKLASVAQLERAESHEL